MENKPLFILNKIAQAIYDKKGINILALYIGDISTISDYVIIAEGNVERHVSAIAKYVVDALSEIGEKPYLVEGMSEGDWVAIDYVGIMVHLFKPGLREHYQLEQLWKEGEIVDLDIEVTS